MTRSSDSSASAKDAALDGLGHRAKVGLLVPATNTIAQPESEALRPRGVTNHVARFASSNRGNVRADMQLYRESLRRGPEHLKAAIDLVLPCEPHAIVLGHSIDTFRDGVRGSEALAAELREHARGVPVILPSHAFRRALEVLGAGRRVASLTPYWPPGDEQVHEFFTSAGYEVTRILGLRCAGPLAIAATPTSVVIESLKALAADRPDVIVQPGTNLPTLRLAVEASAWLGIPVLSCNSVTYWHAMRSLGIADRRDDLGVLWREA